MGDDLIGEILDGLGVGHNETPLQDGDKDKNDHRDIEMRKSTRVKSKLLPPIQREKIVKHWYEEPDEDDPEIKGKLKYREGRYKLGANQFVANPYVYIPGKVMISPQFKISDVFQTMGLGMPSLIFRFSSAKSTDYWNVRLPASRSYLVDAYQSIAEAEDRQGLEHSRDDRSPLIADGEDRLKNLRGSVAHYHSVLEENCKRLLRNTQSACTQAQAIFRVHEVWSDEYHEDAVAQWIQESNPTGSPPIILGVADKSDFHRDVWEKLREGCVSDFDELLKTESEPNDVIIDPRPFFDYEIPIEYKNGRPTRSIPHPAITHLIISDNRELLEQKIGEAVNWGLILINGGIVSARLATQAVQLGLPLICFKYTGGAADICIEMMERVERFIRAKKLKELVDKELPPKPFPEDMAPGYLQANWLMPFEATDIAICNALNVLVENWPDRQNKDTLFTVDMFVTSEDEVQDRLTQTIGSIFSGEYELGGDAAEQMRLSYAWRIRQKFSYNAQYYKDIADNLMFVWQIFIALSTFAAVLYTYFRRHNEMLGRHSAFADYVLVKANLLLPLVATVIQGVNAALSPYLKFVALKNASIRVESEIYAFRCKVGRYNALRTNDDDSESRKNKKDDKKKKKKKEKDNKSNKGDGENANEELLPPPNPRKAFSQAFNSIWQELAASDIQNGSLRNSPFATIDNALEEINFIIRSNRNEQNIYLVPMHRRPVGEQNSGEKRVVEKALLGKTHFNQNKRKRTWVECFRDFKGFKRIAELLQDPNIVYEDGLGTLSADEYLKIRVIPLAAYYSKQAPGLSSAKNQTAAMAVILSVLASALAAFNLVVFVPAVLAIAAGIAAWGDYDQTELRLLQTNSARAQLHQLLLWWESLNVIEKRVVAHKSNLVKKAEAAIQGQATIFQGGGGGAKTEKSEE